MHVVTETITLGEVVTLPVGFFFILLETSENVDIDFRGMGNNSLKKASKVSQSFKLDSGDVRVLCAKIKNSDPLKTQTIKYGFSDDEIRGDFNVVAGEIAVSNLPTFRQDSVYSLGVRDITFVDMVGGASDTAVAVTSASLGNTAFDGTWVLQNLGNYPINFLFGGGVSATNGIEIPIGATVKIRNPLPAQNMYVISVGGIGKIRRSFLRNTLTI